MPTIEQFVTKAEAELLNAGGVGNWEWYSEAMEEYTASDDPFEDAERFITALDNAGVDNWEWYSESLAGLSEYEEYLDSLPNLENVLNIEEWKCKEASKEVTEEANEAVEVEPARQPKGVAESTLHAHIANKYGNDQADEIFALAVEKGVWKRVTFPSEFTAALKSVEPTSGRSFLEIAKQKMLAKVVKNGKLNTFLEGIQ